MSNIYIGNKYDTPLLLINITNKCNYNCHYCFRYTRRVGNKEFIDLSIIDKIVENIDKNFEIQILGGEPTLHPQLFLIIEKLKFYYTMLMTNFSQSINFYLDCFQHGLSILFITIHNHNDEKFIEKILELKEYSNKIKIAFMLDDKFTIEKYELFNFLSKIYEILPTKIIFNGYKVDDKWDLYIKAVEHGIHQKCICKSFFYEITTDGEMIDCNFNTIPFSFAPRTKICSSKQCGLCSVSRTKRIFLKQ